MNEQQLELDLFEPEVEEELKERQFLVHRARCVCCGDVIVSKHSRDFVTCICGSLSIDGGTSCPRSIAKDFNHVNSMNLFSDSPFSEIREWFYRGSRGVDGKQPLTWVKLKDMTDDHLLATIEYCKGEDMLWVYEEELKYRGLSN